MSPAESYWRPDDVSDDLLDTSFSKKVDSPDESWTRKRPSEWTEDERAWVRHIVFGAPWPPDPTTSDIDINWDPGPILRFQYDCPKCGMETTSTSPDLKTCSVPVFGDGEPVILPHDQLAKYARCGGDIGDWGPSVWWWQIPEDIQAEILRRFPCSS